MPLRQRHAITRRRDGHWVMTFDATMKGQKLPAAADSGTFRVQGATLAPDAEQQGVQQFTGKGDTLRTRHAQAVAITRRVTGMDVEAEESLLVRERQHRPAAPPLPSPRTVVSVDGEGGGRRGAAAARTLDDGRGTRMQRVMSKLWLVAVVLGCGPSSSPAQSQGPAQASPQPRSTDGGVRAETVARGLEHPWGLAFLPDGRMLVTEKPGRLRLVSADGRVGEPLAGVPEVYARGQGGLLDVAVDPRFAENRLVYISYSEPGEGGTAGTSVARGRLGEGRLDSAKVIYRQRPKLQGGGHYGSRLVFTRDGKLFVTQGDRMNYRDSAQALSAGMGKIVRINPDGTVPRDNPFAGRDGAQPEIWSYGHRNVQAAALDPESGQLWTVEHGARGGDELNRPEAGKNYGWPVITYGRDYSGARVGEGTAKAEMEQPVYYWDPVIAPSGMVFYTGDAIPGWKGSVLVGSMTPGALVRLVLENGRVAREERYLGDLGERIRDVQQAPDGRLYVITDNQDGRILRVVPAAR